MLAASRLFLVVLLAFVVAVFASILAPFDPTGAALAMGSLYLVNPRGRKGRFVKSKGRKGRKRRRRAKKHGSAPALGAVKHRRRRRRRSSRGLRLLRNPGRRSSGLMGDLAPAAFGAVGAVAVDVAMRFVPTPQTGPLANFAGPLRTAAKIGLALGAGIAVRKAVNKSAGDAVMAGALTVIAYDAVRGLLARFAPNLPLGGLIEDEDAEYPAIGYAGGMGENFPLGESMPGVYSSNPGDLDSLGEVFETDDQ